MGEVHYPSGGLNRKEILRKDCPRCFGNGYLNKPAGEEPCDYPGCEGSGTLELEVPFKFDGTRSKEEIDAMWEEDVARRENRPARIIARDAGEDE